VNWASIRLSQEAFAGVQAISVLLAAAQSPTPVSVEVADHVPDLVLAGEGHPGDRGRVHALR
jgi:hypothetical protein